ncbi:MAG TPA: MBL fold metallo-hydrolase [Thermoplasmata archaeon]|nr:MBL fold metallo-hydrolase [Thermoplasmata archaeon]
MEFGIAKKAKIYTLLEDYAGYNTSFYAQHGISFLIEIELGRMKKRILFDVGQSAEPISYNMKLLGVDPKTIDMIFLSHCHYDHTQGLVGILKEIGKRDIPIVAHPTIFRNHIRLTPYLKTIGMIEENTKEEIEKYGGKFFLTKAPIPIVNGLFSTGEIEVREDFEKEAIIERYTVDELGVYEDKMIDDMSLVLKLDRGIVVISGCSHAGIVSITKKAINLAEEPNVKAIIGGFHLIDAGKERINKTIKRLTEMNVEKVYAGHCTGLIAECRFKEVWKDNFEKLHSGKLIEFKEG